MTSMGFYGSARMGFFVKLCRLLVDEAKINLLIWALKEVTQKRTEYTLWS